MVSGPDSSLAVLQAHPDPGPGLLGNACLELGARLGLGHAEPAPMQTVAWGVLAPTPDVMRSGGPGDLAA